MGLAALGRFNTDPQPPRFDFHLHTCFLLSYHLLFPLILSHWEVATLSLVRDICHLPTITCW